MPDRVAVILAEGEASFLKPMLCESSNSLPEGPDWEYELFVLI
jgi:hypothetical protein